MSFRNIYQLVTHTRIFYEWTNIIFGIGFKSLEEKGTVVNIKQTDTMLMTAEAGWWVHEGLLFFFILDIFQSCFKKKIPVFFNWMAVTKNESLLLWGHQMIILFVH